MRHDPCGSLITWGGCIENRMLTVVLLSCLNYEGVVSASVLHLL